MVRRSAGVRADSSPWLIKNLYLFAECKNFGEEIGNPEIDQMAMRLSSSRGMFGMVVCRKIEGRKRLLQRCQAIARDDKKFFVVLDDGDLRQLVEEEKFVFPQDYEFPVLKNTSRNLFSRS